jgi:fatty-acyl-CoA synthase
MLNGEKYGKSYAHGGAGPPLLGITVSGVLDAAAVNWPDQDALIVADQNVRWSWSELREQLTAWLAGAGF